MLCCTAARFDPEMYDARASKVRAEGVGSIADVVLERWFTPEFRAARPETVESAGNMLRGTPVEGYAGCCEALRDADVREARGDRAPTLVIAGGKTQRPPWIRQRRSATRSAGAPRRGRSCAPGEHRAARSRDAGDPGTSGAGLRGRKMTSEDSTYDRGMKVRREVLGDDMDRTIGRTTEFTADFQDFITRYAWGEIWSRPAWTAKREAASPSPRSSRWAASTNWSCTCAPPSATA